MLNDFNVVIGANASGKSNFINVLQFLKDIAENGLSNAISIHGGIEYVRNIMIGWKEDLTVEIQGIPPERMIGFHLRVEFDGKSQLVSFDVTEQTYLFDLTFTEKTDDYLVKLETIKTKFELYTVERKKLLQRDKKISSGELNLNRSESGKITHSIKHTNPRLRISPEQLIGNYPINPSDKELFFVGFHELSELLFSPITVSLNSLLRTIEIFNIDPAQSKKSTAISGKTKLESDGSNLAIALKRILEKDVSKSRFLTVMKDILPFVENVNVQKFADRSLLPAFQESYCKSNFMPSPWMSDGTINVTALIAALYFGDGLIVVIEEPERNIHPSLISKLIENMKDAGKALGKQIILTTHSPAVVKCAGIKSLLLLRRPDCYSEIIRPFEKEEVKIFLKNDFGVDDLFIQNLLGV
jgi:predicted ATPase